MEQVVARVTRVSDGLEFGDGKISAEAVSADVLQAVDLTIETNPDILVPIDADDNGIQIDDDGCGDGRGVKRIMQRVGGGMREFGRSLNRAKVFGGALAMAVGVRIGAGAALGHTLESVFGQSRSELDDKDINYGGHTAEHVTPGREELDCGCGAIDLAPQIVQAAVRLEQPIRDAIKHLGVDAAGVVDNVFTNYESYGATIAGQPEYSGKRVMSDIMDAEKVVKELEGAHLECRIILNTVAGYTVNQALIREVSDGKAQVFAVDVWRLQKIATELCPSDEAAQTQAFISELVYTLATAGVLTKGDLPVYVIENEAALQIA